MPIYVYHCSHCGHQEDVLQKLHDPRLTVCPACGQQTYEKQIAAAEFRLKGTGWYETDFRGGGKHTASATPPPSGGHSSATTSG